MLQHRHPSLCTKCLALFALIPCGTLVAGSTIEETWVTNPSSGVEIHTTVIYPDTFDSSGSFPGIVLVPGGSGTGNGFFASGHAQALADLGVVSIYFDPDGRGQSTNGGTYVDEDYCGFIQQDGLRAILQHLVAIPGVDPENIGVQSRSYGITMAAGCLGRYPTTPRVKYLVEWEGPAERTDTAAPNGHVPVPPSDEEFWYEREPGNFINDFGGYVLFMQSEVDHVQPDNAHTILLNNRAVHQSYSGEGRAFWTRVNEGGGPFPNPTNTTWTLEAPPNWLPEWMPLEARMVDFVEELVGMPPRPFDADINADGIVDGADLALVLIAWATDDPFADVNADQLVDGADLALVLVSWTP